MLLPGDLVNSPCEQMLGLVALNVTAATALASWSVRAFGSRGRGALLNLSSMLAPASENDDGAYSAGKADVLRLRP